MRVPLTVALALCLLACGGEEATTPSGGAPHLDQTPAEFVARQQANGKVTVLLLGMESCGSTRDFTSKLAGLCGDLGEDVAVARVDVPPPGGSTDPVEDWPHPYYYGLDEERAVADSLEFFFYPTVYLLDRDGEVRYSGGLEPAKLAEMVAALREEEPDGEKVFFTKPLPAVGSDAPAVAGRDLKGLRVKIEVGAGRPTVVFFTSATCPFSSEALIDLPVTLLDFEDEEFDLVVVEKGGSASAIEALHEGVEVEGAVLHDRDGSIFEAYGVEPVPFFFVLDEDGKIASRGPYAEGTFKVALGKTLGVEVEPIQGGSSGAG